MTPQILVTENIDGPWLEKLRSVFPVRVEPRVWESPNTLKKIIPDYQALILRNQTQLTSEIITEGSQLQIIGRAGSGLNNVDVEAATAAGIVVTNTPEQNSISVAELAVGMMVALARKLTIANNHVRAGQWQRQRFMGTELYDKILGVIGLGRIGFLTALRAKALGMHIIVYDTYIDRESSVVTKTNAKLVELDELLSQADFVSCHIPLTSETENIFRYEQFCRMKSTAFFLNLARGGIVEEEDLLRALEEGQISGAALDVREQEPPYETLFSEVENIILTPHMAAFTHEAQKRVLATVGNDVTSVLNGKAAKNYVNFSTPKRPVK